MRVSEETRLDTPAPGGVEEALLDSEERFRLLAETANDAILVADGRGTIRFANRAATLIFGHSRDELLGQSVTLLMPEGSRSSHLRAMERAAKGESRGILGSVQEVTGVAKDGTEIPLEISLSASGRGEHALFFAFLRDISDRKASEEALEEVIRHHELVLGSVAEGILVVGEDRTLEFLNVPAMECTGWSEEEVLGRDIHEVLHPASASDPFLNAECPSEEECPVLATLLDGRPHRGETVIARKDGSTFPARFSSTPFRAGEGRGGAVVVFEDVGGTRDLEVQLRQAQKMEAVGHLTGGIAHDFNNLLSVILLHAEAMGTLLEPEHSLLRSSLTDIHRAAEKAAAMTGKLLGFSRRAPLKSVPLDVAKVVRGMGSMLRRVLPETIDFRVETREGVAPARADAGAVEQILMNLATNARDAMPHGGALGVEVERVKLGETEVRSHPRAEKGAYVRVLVSDTGTGMDPETLERAFDPFFTTKGAGEGTGLGLAMVYGLMEQQGGFVMVESEPGKGTEVALYFPMIHDEPTALPDPDFSEEPGLEGTETILVVEDDPGLRDVAVRSLTRSGYSTLEASNGEEAMTTLVARSGEVDLVLTDVVMPRMGGVTLFRHARKAGFTQPFLFTSGYMGGGGEEADLPEEGAAFLAKPWRKRTLLRSIRTLLDERAPPPSGTRDTEDRRGP